MAGARPPKPRRDLGIRTFSGVLLLGLFAGAVWLGGAAFAVLVALFGGLALFEWQRIARGMHAGPGATLAWIAAGVVYIGMACAVVVTFRRVGIPHALLPILATAATDTGAYFAGRAIGGPRIAPRISPSKTWAGLFGGMLAAGAFTAWWNGHFAYRDIWTPGIVGAGFALGAVLAVVAQAGDFLESWMKRRAGLKDSGTLIPGHGGVLDRVDGLLAVLVASGLAWLALGAIVE
jgi:phosphatidate cytidylyltransferase